MKPPAAEVFRSDPKSNSIQTKGPNFRQNSNIKYAFNESVYDF